MPSFFNSSAFFSNPGNCWEEHVGVNAPGKLNKITLLFFPWLSLGLVDDPKWSNAAGNLFNSNAELDLDLT